MSPVVTKRYSQGEIVDTKDRIAISLEHIECLLTDIRDSLKQRQPATLDTVEFVDNPILAVWNKYACESFARAQQQHKDSPRTRNTVLRWKEKPKEDYWVRVILKLNASDWCKGKNPNNWKADFDFLVKEGTHYKAIEGKYDNKDKVEVRLIGHTACEERFPVYETVKK